MNEKQVKKPGKVSLVLICLLLVVALIANIACYALRGTLDQYLGSKPRLSDDLAQTGDDLALQVQEEGTVLLRNEDGALPLSKETKQVNVFGWSATQWIQGGSGSGQCATLETDLLAALKEAGISYNEELIQMYTDFQSTRPYFADGTLHTYPAEFCRLYEPSVNDTDYYSEALLANAEAYSDTAIVVIGRVGGESNDAPKTQYKQVVKNGEIIADDTRTYLDLSTEEEELLTYVGVHFETVIVLVNNTNMMSLAPLESIPGIDACLLLGGTGENGAKAIPSILYGDVNPSGRLTDTYAYDLKTSSTYANSGDEGLGYYTNADGLYPADGVTTNGNLSDNALYPGVAYVDYAENIYVGYKWYETAYIEGYWDNVSNEFGTGYEGVVQYPFGYGLSYTSFDWEIVDATQGELDRNDQVSVTVKVTNTGDVAGKDVVQFYFNPPYYTGEIEKSAVVLGDFAKTRLLQPGESEEVTLTLDVYDMASYDCYDANQNGFVGYELDRGDYQFMVSRNAHDVVDSFTCTISDNIQYPEDPVTGAEVKNLFVGESVTDGVSLDGSDSEANITFMTRADFAGTFPAEKAADRAMADNIRALNLYTTAMAEAWAAEEAQPIATGAQNGLSVTNADGSISELGLALGADYNDPQWDALLDQLTIQEMTDLAVHGYVHTAALPSIGKTQTLDLDGPSQVASFAGWLGAYGAGFSNPVVIAQTYNKDIGYQFGLVCGAQAKQLGISGWYAPGVNIHRSAFGGRNYEYYSEDAYVSGVFGMLASAGSLDAGTFVYAKHFIVYDQEAARDGCYTWMTEQTLRENYLAPFKMMIQEGGLTGIMSAYNRVGAVWAGGSEALLTELLREEWGFQGAVITDYADHHVFMNGDQSLRAGGDMWMDGWLSDGTLAQETESNRFQQALRRAAKDVAYMCLNAAYRNRQYAENGGDPTCVVEPNQSINLWLTTLIAVDVVVVLIAASYFVLRTRKLKRYQAQNQA
ncbi:MAG: glycoside hydrolase family 3 C-terminal domain-containing protein [Candidatus Onthomonas sp.]